MWDMKDVTNVEAAASVVPTKTSSGSIPRAGTASSSGSRDGMAGAMIEEGDSVVYVRDGARGVVVRVEEDRYLILWEDTFVSWEPVHLLEKIKK